MRVLLRLVLLRIRSALPLPSAYRVNQCPHQSLPVDRLTMDNFQPDLLLSHSPPP
jgi:hypothetical protein